MSKLAFGIIALGFLLNIPVWAFLGSDKTMYLGGTSRAIKDQTEGKSSAKDEKVFVFEYKGGKLEIPYDRINLLQYGQKAGWRVFSMKRAHFLTINYRDENDKQQVAVFELEKDVVRVTLSVLEVRTGRKIEYQDDEAQTIGKSN